MHLTTYVPTSAHSTQYKLLLNLQIYIFMIVLLCNELNKTLDNETKTINVVQNSKSRDVIVNGGKE